MTCRKIPLKKPIQLAFGSSARLIISKKTEIFLVSRPLTCFKTIWLLLFISPNRQTRDKSKFVTKFVGIAATIIGI